MFPALQWVGNIFFGGYHIHTDILNTRELAHKVVKFSNFCYLCSLK